MGDFVKRTEIDRKLFERGVKDQLRDLVKITDAPRLAKAIIQVIEMQVASEELARLNEVEINSETVG
ncbi:hypothetical protein H8D57_01520, partial [bacterium]|nr:hypothetical protein [bacterium]